MEWPLVIEVMVRSMEVVVNDGELLPRALTPEGRVEGLEIPEFGEKFADGVDVRGVRNDSRVIECGGATDEVAGSGRVDDHEAVGAFAVRYGWEGNRGEGRGLCAHVGL